MAIIKLLGEAGRTFTREVELDIQTVGEAVRALCALFPGFEEWVLDADARGIGWRVIVDDPKGVSEEDLQNSVPVPKQLILAPIIRGKGPLLLIIAGVALIGAGIVIGIGTFFGGILLTIGLSLLLQGIAQVLSPTAARKAALQKKSFLFTGSNLESVQGTSLPILYGESVIQGAPVLSFGVALEAGDFVYTTTIPRDIEVLEVLDQDLFARRGGFWIGPYAYSGVWFSARLVLRFPIGGRYKITGSADDDIRFYMDDVLVAGESTGTAGPTVEDIRYYSKGIHVLKIELRNTIADGDSSYAQVICLEPDDGRPVNTLDIVQFARNWHNSRNQFRYTYTIY